MDLSQRVYFPIHWQLVLEEVHLVEVVVRNCPIEDQEDQLHQSLGMPEGGHLVAAEH